MSETVFGFVGLGNMGGHMAANMHENGTSLVVFDKAGTAERAPEGAAQAGSAAEIASKAETVFLCLPDGFVVQEVIGELLDCASSVLRRVVDTSTIGIAAAE
ncbi:MAG TPA: NAD(P)-binding domain-containing protein, partial [Gammaproteobacteria bacterium]|nr:NAD(P)-binding domain-containing protein [Gammaproteobacteria bacterium]